MKSSQRPVERPMVELQRSSAQLGESVVMTAIRWVNRKHGICEREGRRKQKLCRVMKRRQKTCGKRSDETKSEVCGYVWDTMGQKFKSLMKILTRYCILFISYNPVLHSLYPFSCSLPYLTPWSLQAPPGPSFSFFLLPSFSSSCWSAFSPPSPRSNRITDCDSACVPEERMKLCWFPWGSERGWDTHTHEHPHMHTPVHTLRSFIYNAIIESHV